MMKLCPYCESEKPEGEFLPKNLRCYSCRCAKTKEYREKRKAEGRPYHLTQNSNRKRTIRQQRAHMLVTQAVKFGHLTPPKECEVCGNGPKPFKRLDAHHSDYLKPLEVVWVCRNCHIHIHDAPDAHINADGPIIPEIFRLPFKARKGASRFFGVSFYKDRQLWGAGITINGKGIHLGRFQTEEEAARARDKAALEHFGPTALFNFPSEISITIGTQP